MLPLSISLIVLTAGLQCLAVQAAGTTAPTVPGAPANGTAFSTCDTGSSRVLLANLDHLLPQCKPGHRPIAAAVFECFASSRVVVHNCKVLVLPGHPSSRAGLDCRVMRAQGMLKGPANATLRGVLDGPKAASMLQRQPSSKLLQGMDEAKLQQQLVLGMQLLFGSVVVTQPASNETSGSSSSSAAQIPNHSANTTASAVHKGGAGNSPAAAPAAAQQSRHHHQRRRSPTHRGSNTTGAQHPPQRPRVRRKGGVHGADAAAPPAAGAASSTQSSSNSSGAAAHSQSAAADHASQGNSSSSSAGTEAPPAPPQASQAAAAVAASSKGTSAAPASNVTREQPPSGAAAAAPGTGAGAGRRLLQDGSSQQAAAAAPAAVAAETGDGDPTLPPEADVAAAAAAAASDAEGGAAKGAAVMYRRDNGIILQASSACELQYLVTRNPLLLQPEPAKAAAFAGAGRGGSRPSRSRSSSFWVSAGALFAGVSALLALVICFMSAQLWARYRSYEVLPSEPAAGDAGQHSTQRLAGPGSTAGLAVGSVLLGGPGDVTSPEMSLELQQTRSKSRAGQIGDNTALQDQAHLNS